MNGRSCVLVPCESDISQACGRYQEVKPVVYCKSLLGYNALTLEVFKCGIGSIDDERPIAQLLLDIRVNTPITLYDNSITLFATYLLLYCVFC